MRRHAPLLLLLLVTAAGYAALWPAAFSWDDIALVQDNQVTGSLANLPKFFQMDLWSTTKLPTLQSGYYRPLMLTSLAVDRALFGLDATAAHVHSLLWHLGAVGALYALLNRLLGDAWRALVGATLFALHPVQSEVLALVAARNDSMAAALVMGALVLLVDRETSPARLIGAGLLALAGLLSKESAVLAPVMLLAMDLGRWRRPGPWRRYVPLGLALAVFLALRSWAGVGGALVPDEDNWALVASRSLHVAAVYGSLLVWPWPLTPARHIHYLPPLGSVLFGLVVCLGLLGAAVAKGRHRGLVIAGVVWAVLAFAPSLLATLDKGLLGERYLYFSLAGLGLVLAAAVERPPRWLPVAMAVPALAALQIRLPQWKDSQTVWRAAHEAAPSPFTAAGLGWYVHHEGQFEESLPLFVQALEGDPPYLDACELILQAHLQAKKVREAAEVGRWAIEERGCPLTGEIVGQYAVALAGLGEWDQAVRAALLRPGGPAGSGLIVVAAAAARRGDLNAVVQLSARVPGPPSFPARVARLLRLSGDGETADRVLALESPSQ